MIRKRKIVIFLVVFIFIILLTCSFLFLYSKSINNKLIKMSKINIDIFYKDIFTNKINYDILNDSNLNDILVLHKNKDDEIIYIDYDLNKAYLILKLLTDTLYFESKNYQNEIIKNINNNKVIVFPLLISSNIGYLSNLGPKIYVKFVSKGSVLTNIKTSVSNYGLNNSLIQLYATLSITENIVTPFSNDDINLNYDVLLASKVVNGRVPSFYGNLLNSESNVLKN